MANPHVDEKFLRLRALAVRPGDVAAVPEPGTPGLLVPGIAATQAGSRRRT